MGRIRTLKPELLEDERTANLSDAGFRLFVASILLADDYGNLRAGAGYLAGAAFHARPGSLEQADAALSELCAPGTELMTLYAVHGQRYAAIRGWTKHQRIDNAGKARVPGPDTETACVITDIDQSAANRGETARNAAPTPTPTPTSDSDPDRRTSLSHAPRARGRIAAAEVDAAYQAYPRKVGKTRGMRKLLADLKPGEGPDLLRAAENYAAYVRGQRTEEQYVKHFSTWAGEWRDWINPPEFIANGQPPAKQQAHPGNGRDKGLSARDLFAMADELERKGQP